MKSRWIQRTASVALAAMLFSGASVSGFQAAKDKMSKAAPAAASKGPGEKEIADAKAKGLVWVNTASKVYHKEGQFYGKTKQGQFMTEADAQKAGYRAPHDSPVKKKAADTKKK